MFFFLILLNFEDIVIGELPLDRPSQKIENWKLWRCRLVMKLSFESMLVDLI